MPFTKLKVVGVAVVFALLGWTPGALADPITLPPSAASVEGNSAQCIPFTCSAQPFEYWQLYSSSLFTGSPVLLTGMRFRPDAEFGASFTTTLSDVDLAVGFRTEGGPILHPEFGLIFGLAQGVHTGPLTISSAFTGPSGGPKDFDIFIPFSTPFLYDPSYGNLFFRLRIFGDVQHSSTTPALLDAVSGTDTGLSRGIGGPLFVPNGGLVTQFETAAPVPEPASMLLVGTGLLGAGVRRWRQKRA